MELDRDNLSPTSRKEQAFFVPMDPYVIVPDLIVTKLE